MSYFKNSALAILVLSTTIFMGFVANNKSEAIEEVEEPVVEEALDKDYKIDVLGVITIDKIVTRIISERNRATKKTIVTVAREGSLDCESYRNIIEEKKWNAEIAMNVCKAESGGVEFAENTEYHEDAGCHGSWGLFQVACVHGYTKEQMFDPAQNIEAAYRIWLAGGGSWSPWGVCHDGTVYCAL